MGRERRKRGALLLAGLLLCTGILGGCAEGQAPVQQTAMETKTILVNDGREAKLVLAQVDHGEARTAVLREIADKYQADFPHTEIEIVTYRSREELEQAVSQGQQADLLDLDRDGVVKAAGNGQLLDLYDALRGWEDYHSLTQEFWQAARTMGRGSAYVMPYDFSQKLTYYRADWFGAYNEGKKETDMAWCRTWPQIAKAQSQLGEQAMVALGGKDCLVDYFDSVMWSAVGRGRMEDPAAAYFAAGEEHTTIFTLEQASQGVELFREVFQSLVLPEALNWTEEEAVEAFIQGKAGILVADKSVGQVLAQQMEEGSWDTEGPPRGESGTAIFADEFEGWAVNAQCETPEIAAHFLLFLSNGDNNTHFAKMCGTLPIHSTSLEMEAALWEGERAEEIGMIQKTEWFQYANEPEMYQAWEQYRPLADRLLREFLAGKSTQQALLEELDQYWSAAYREEGRLMVQEETTAD